MSRRFVPVFVFVVLSICVMAAQTSSEPHSPREKLNYFAGTWSIEMHVNAGALGSRAYFTTEHNEWVADHSLLLSRPDANLALPTGGLAVMGYSATKSAYTYHIVKSNGEAEDLNGIVDGQTWTWTSDGSRTGPPSPKTRITMKEISSTLYIVRVETCSEDDAWSTVMEGSARKVVSHTHQDVAFLR